MTSPESVPLESAPTADVAPTEPSATQPGAGEYEAVIEDYAVAFDATSFPDTSSGCQDWFDEWATRSIGVQGAAARLLQPEVAEAVANHQAATAAAVADCLEGRPIDHEDLEEQQRRLVEVLG